MGRIFLAAVCGCLLVAGALAWHPRRGVEQPAPVRLGDDRQWVADHGQPDRVGLDYFDRLATQVWRLPSSGAGWQHSDVEVMTYGQAHVNVFFVMVPRDGLGWTDDFRDQFTWEFYGCSDSRTDRLLVKCPGFVGRKG
jgi:hypothetical protein